MLVRLTNNGNHQNKFSASFHQFTAEEGKPLIPAVANSYSKGGARPPFNLLKFAHNMVAQKGGTPSFQRHTVFKLCQNSKEADKPTPLKMPRRSRSFSLYFSHHIPLLNCHSPSTVKETLHCCDGSAREPLWHCDHSEQGEPSVSELSQHASLVSWQRRPMVMSQCHSPELPVLEKKRHHLA